MYTAFPPLYALLCLLAALAVLVILSVIDLRTRLLPNRWVIIFAALGAGFHLSTAFYILTPLAMCGGAITGGVFLLAVRCVANRLYRTDTLGMGDVKLMTAAGLWLGPPGILMAITIGAASGVIHGLMLAVMTAFRTKNWPKMTQFSLPAGPGFAVGIAAALFMMLLQKPDFLLSLLP